MKTMWLEILVLGAATSSDCAPPRSDIAVPGGNPRALAVGDVNGDGRDEILVGHALSPDPGGELVGASAYATKADDTFQSRLVALTAFEPDALLLADLNGDGKLDLVAIRATQGGGGNVRILLGRGDGTFYAAGELEDVGAPMAVAAGDVDGNGTVDLVVSSAAPGPPLQIHEGRGDGSFARPRFYYGADASRHLAVGDVNGDGKPDIVLGTSKGSVDVLLNDGSGGLLAPVRTRVGEGEVSIALADLGGHGRPSIVAGADRSASVSVIEASGIGLTATAYPLPTPANGVAVGDVNGDGKLEICAIHTIASALSVLERTERGVYTLYTTVAVGRQPASLALADVHGTGKRDAITANPHDGTLSIVHFPAALSGRGGAVPVATP